MLDTILSVVSTFSSTVATAKKGYDAYKQVCAIAKGETRTNPLDRIATSFERLSEKILYAPNLNAVEDVGRTQQRYVTNLREVREALDPIQRAIGTDILSSAMILTPEKMQQTLVKNPWEVLMDVRPVPLFSAKLPPEGIPVLFEHGGIQYLGWQLRGTLPILFNCRYDELWLSSSIENTVDLGQIFEFVIVTVDARGKVIRKKRKQAQQVKEDLGNGVILEMVYILGGTFLMGSPVGEKDSSDHERPQHSVTIRPFYMGKYPVTVGEFKQFVTATHYRTDAEKGDGAYVWTGGGWEKKLDANWKNPYFAQAANHPVVCVSWNDAKSYCQWLSERTSRYYRLPSEAQWEYACRAGTTTPFAFGETLTTGLANYDGNSTYVEEPKGKYRKQATPVGTFPPNAFGLYDMHGNVREWCEDAWHSNYAGAPTNGSAWITGGIKQQYHPLRGGTWSDNTHNCRSANRSWYDNGDGDIGFRLSCFS